MNLSADFDVAPARVSKVDAYLDGIASVLPRSRIGVYSSTWCIDHLAGNGKATWFWQSMSGGYSGGQNATLNSHTNIWQRGSYTTPGGSLCDWDYAITGDCGQWGAGPRTTHIYALAPSGAGVFQWSGSGQNWAQIEGPAGALYAGGSQLFATNPTSGDIYQYNGVPNNWSRIGGPGYSFASTDTVTVAVSPSQDGVFAWSGSGTAWSQIGGPADELVTGS